MSLMTSSPKLPSTWTSSSSSLTYEDTQIQTGLENLLRDKHFCLQASNLYRRGNQLYWKAHVVLWFTRANWQKKRVKAWVFNSGRSKTAKNLSSDNTFIHSSSIPKLRSINYTQWASPQCRYKISHWRFIRGRTRYTSPYVYQQTASLQQGIIPTLGTNLLPLLANYAKTKCVTLRLSYSCLPLRRGSRGVRKRFAYYKRAPFFRSSNQILSFLFRTPGKSSILSHFIKHQVQINYRDRRRMKWFLSFLGEILNFYWKKSSRLIAGLCIQINGRLNRRARKFNLKKVYSVGKLSFTSTEAHIAYDDNIAFTKNGQVQIRVWTHYNSSAKPGLSSFKASSKILERAKTRGWKKTWRPRRSWKSRHKR